MSEMIDRQSMPAPLDDLISRKALVEQIKYRMESRIRAEDFSPGFARALLDIMEAPTVAAEPVRHGRWIEDRGIHECSKCGAEQMQNDWDEWLFTNFCPNCGARMDAKEDMDGRSD